MITHIKAWVALNNLGTVRQLIYSTLILQDKLQHRNVQALALPSLFDEYGRMSVPDT